MTAESKHDKFVRLSGARLERALHHIALLENLAGHGYESDEDEAMALVASLDKAVAAVSLAFGVQGCPGVPVPVDGCPAGSCVTTADRDDGDEDDRPGDGHANMDDAGPEFPTYAEGIELMRIGPRVGEAVEAIEDGDPGTAKAILLRLLVA